MIDSKHFDSEYNCIDHGKVPPLHRDGQMLCPDCAKPLNVDVKMKHDDLKSLCANIGHPELYDAIESYSLSRVFGLTNAVAELKHSIKCYIGMTCTPRSPYSSASIADLSAFAMKLMDILSSVASGVDPKPEVNNISRAIIKAIADGVRQRLEIAKSEHAGAEDIIKVFDTVVGSDTDDPIRDKYRYLRATSIALAALEEYTKCSYPKITDLRGVQI